MVRIKSILAKYAEQTGVKPDAAITYTNRDYSVSETELMLAATRFSDMNLSLLVTYVPVLQNQAVRHTFPKYAEPAESAPNW